MKSYVSHESYYQCDCGYEALLVRQYTYDLVAEPVVELAIFSQSCRCKTWKEQLRWIWAIITQRQIWADQIILNVDEMERLGTQLTNLAKRIKEDENSKRI